VNCKICNSKLLNKFLNLRNQPWANKYPKNPLEIFTEEKYGMQIFICNNCLTVQLGTILSRNRMFEDYYYLSSVNQKLVKHFNSLAKKIRLNEFVVDIGSNDGILLEPLIKKGVKAIGVDPSKNVGKIANKKGLKTLIGFFNSKIVKKIINEYEKADVIIASSIFTHLNDPLGFIENCRDLLKNDGRLIIEIEYIADLIKNIEFERFYFDRPFYYSINSIILLCKKVNMYLTDIEKLDIHGSSVRLIIKKHKKNTKYNKIQSILKKEKLILNKKNLNIFNKLILKEAKKLKSNLENFKKNNKKVIGYGSPARLATITNFCKINNQLIECIIEDSPLKQNKFTPGMHIPILGIDDVNINNYQVIIVFAYEYFEDIKKKINNKNLKYYKPIPFKHLR